MKAMPVAVSNCTVFLEQLPRSLSMSTVMPADAQAAANVRLDVTCREDTGLLKFTQQLFLRGKK